jgi:hypothetical protein
MKIITIIAFLMTLTVIGQTNKKVCFIGNSYTYYNNLPGILENMAAADGNSLLTAQHTPGGSTLEQHSTNSTALSKIASDDWDYVVLQDQSQRPSFPWTQVNNDVFPYAAILCDSIRSANPCAIPLFFNTWGRRDGDAQWDSINTFDKMNERLFNAYGYMANEHSAKRSPVGIGFDHIHNDSNSPITHAALYTSDGSHPSVYGSYLAACFFYELIFEENSEGNAYMPSGISNSEGFYLQTVAHHILTDVDSVRTDFTQPMASFEYNVNALEVSFFNNTERSTSWLWDFGDGNTDNTENPVHAYASTGVYDVNLISDNYCISDDTTVTITLSSASLDEQAIDEFQVFPNPSHGEFNISYAGNKTSGIIYNYSGQTVKRFDLNDEVLSLPQGLYTVKIGESIQRLVVVN